MEVADFIQLAQNMPCGNLKIIIFLRLCIIQYSEFFDAINFLQAVSTTPNFLTINFAKFHLENEKSNTGWFLLVTNSK